MGLAGLFSLLCSLAIWLIGTVFVLFFAIIFLGYTHSEKRLFSAIEFPDLSAHANLATVLFVFSVGLIMFSTTAFTFFAK